MVVRNRVAILIAAVVLAACGSTGPSATPPASGPPPTPTPAAAEPTPTPRPAAELYAEIRAAVSAIRGFEPSGAVDPVTIDEAQLRKNLETGFDKDNKPQDIANAEDLLQLLELLPPDSSIRAITLDFQSGQVAGYYSPDDDKLFVISRGGNLGAIELVTYAHEFTHQLQDQAIGLDKLGLDTIDESDQALARLALVEGDATSVQTQWMLANLDSSQIGELLGAAMDPDALAALQRAPRVIRETALFPYDAGAAFVQACCASSNAAVDAVYADPPSSTEQIIHPEKYDSREQPVDVKLPAGLAGAMGAGWSIAAEDTFGELMTRIWLTEGKVRASDASVAAAGWGGDRLALLRGPNNASAVVWLTAWDSSAEATEFAQAAAPVLQNLAPRTTTGRSGDGLRVWIALGPTPESVSNLLSQ